MQAVPAAAGFRIIKSKLEIVVAEKPVKGPPCFVAPAAVPGYAVRFETRGNRATGFNGLLIEAGLFTALTIKALRSDGHKVVVRFAMLRFQQPIQRFETGPRMSQVVVHGNTVYLAGVVAKAAAGKSVTEQTQDVLSIIDGLLEKAGSDKSKLLSATIYLTDIKTFADMNAVWDKWVSPGNTPARATVEAKLATPDYKVEIMVVAARA